VIPRRRLLQSALGMAMWPTHGRAEAVQRGRVLAFPRDHGAHLDAAIEWWYLTGWLQADDGTLHGFQLTFFRSRTGLAEDSTSRFAARQLLHGHAAWTDLGQHRHHHAQRVARWNGDPAARPAFAALDDTALALGGWALQREPRGGFSHYRARFDVADARVELELDALAPPLLQGEAGWSQKGPREASHYVSEPQLRARGVLHQAGRARPVQGRAWLDHEWSDSLLPEQAVGWDWVGMNLDDGSALTAFQLRATDGRAVFAGGSWRGTDGNTSSFAADTVNFKPGRSWRSPASGATYPLHWQLDTPAGTFGVRALLDAQELDSRASTGTAYWEGLSELLDAQQRRVGLGYLEMTGYAGRLRLG
jgi:predicted secreted hydrolase